MSRASALSARHQSNWNLYFVILNIFFILTPDHLYLVIDSVHAWIDEICSVRETRARRVHTGFIKRVYAFWSSTAFDDRYAMTSSRQLSFFGLVARARWGECAVTLLGMRRRLQIAFGVLWKWSWLATSRAINYFAQRQVIGLSYVDPNASIFISGRFAWLQISSIAK